MVGFGCVDAVFGLCLGVASLLGERERYLPLGLRDLLLLEYLSLLGDLPLGLIAAEPPSELPTIRISLNGKETICESSRRELGIGNLKGVGPRFEEFGATFAVRTGVGGC